MIKGIIVDDCDIPIHKYECMGDLMMKWAFNIEIKIEVIYDMLRCWTYEKWCWDG